MTAAVPPILTARFRFALYSAIRPDTASAGVVTVVPEAVVSDKEGTAVRKSAAVKVWVPLTRVT
ncbi:hypothetical protein D3C76_1550420 [compost metagenome]